MQITHESEVCAFCQELVRCPSLSGDEKGVADLVEREMVMLGYDEVYRDDLGSVVGVVYGARPGPRILFDGHMDVVPVTSPEAWFFPPYSGERADGCIWGRGAADVKGSLAAALIGIGTLPHEGLSGSIIMSASVGEEAIEGLALEHVLAHHPADGVVICEPTGLRLGIGHKGRTGMVLSAEGVAAHSSEPAQGINAVYRMIEAVSRVRRMPPHRDERLGVGVSELVEMVSSPYPGTSMVPHGCSARFDRRLVRGETSQTVLDEMREALSGLDGLSVRCHQGELHCYTGRSFMVEDFHLAWALAPDSDMVRRALEGLADAGQDPELYLAPYCTNGATSAGKLGIPSIIYGAGEVADAHIVNESVSIDSLIGAFHGYQGLARALTSESRHNHHSQER